MVSSATAAVTARTAWKGISFPGGESRSPHPLRILRAKRIRHCYLPGSSDRGEAPDLNTVCWMGRADGTVHPAHSQPRIQDSQLSVLLLKRFPTAGRQRARSPIDRTEAQSPVHGTDLCYPNPDHSDPPGCSRPDGDSVISARRFSARLSGRKNTNTRGTTQFAGSIEGGRPITLCADG